ncbi:hypothetical protein AX17_004983 [Amanita inopinata Kibby_2008]|nr:hypothetical protein AX17_004983 [Amanita inopinata Kibby_2008]
MSPTQMGHIDTRTVYELVLANPWKRPRFFPPDPSRVYKPIDPSCYIPLTILTAEAFRDASGTAEMDGDMKYVLQSEKGNLTMKPVPFDASGEDKISLPDWIDASMRYVDVLGRYLLGGRDEEPGGRDAQKIARSWEAHFSLIRKQGDFTRRFELYRLYDIHVRRTWHETREKIRPDVWHDSLLE